MCAQFHVHCHKFYLFISSICFYFAWAVNFFTKCTNQLNKKSKKWMRDSLPRVGSVLKILIGKVCQKCNVSSVIVNSRLVQEFKTKIWRLNQALAKAKTKGGNGLRKLFSQWTYGKYSTWSFKIYYNELESVRLQNETVN